MRVLFGRHCRTALNAQRRIQGHKDPFLDEVGVDDARRLACEVAGYGITHVYCSDLQRSRVTASYVSAVTHAIVHVDRRWRECGFGSLDGLTYEEFNKACGPQNARPADPLGSDFRPFGGEHAGRVLRRQTEALAEIKAAHDAETVMVVGHGRSLLILLTSLGHPTEFLRQNGAYVVVEC